MEEELAKHLKQLADQFHGLAPVKCRELAFEYAEITIFPVPVQRYNMRYNVTHSTICFPLLPTAQEKMQNRKETINDSTTHVPSETSTAEYVNVLPSKAADALVVTQELPGFQHIPPAFIHTLIQTEETTHAIDTISGT
ncbi:unnamed protein product [Pleuronectes platessa]|uniref:Uncharacterized protein n=1 Tax=Pleuronectes platessa TaxID=8262 RepID=A0A9N7VFK0_PLEPL|nr:unnamed protein product [Pleuronectes platessa]